MSWVLKGSTRVACRQIDSILDSFLEMSDHVPIKCPHFAEMHHVLESEGLGFFSMRYVRGSHFYVVVLKDGRVSV